MSLPATEPGPSPCAATEPASPLPVTITRPATSFREEEGLADQIAHFLLRKRQFPELSHEALVIGKYYLIDKIDEGAMGIVCTALERHFGTVALKIPKLAPDRQLRARVLREGQLLARVHHTNVLRIYEVGEWEDTIYIATEYVEGQTLRAWQSVAGRGWRAIVGAYLQAARGLAAIHTRKIVHQDIKPDNIRIDAHGTVRVLDFGLAHLETRLLEEPVLGVPLAGPTFYRGGTPGYMAPEQYRSDRPIDVRADQFAFCASLWEALHGSLPYPANVIASTVVGAPRRPLGPPHTREVGAVPRWLRKILLRGLAEHREQRFASMDLLSVAIEQRLHRRWWPFLALGGATGLAGAAVTAMLSGPSLPMCLAPEETLATLRTAAREPELAAVATTLRDPTAARTWSAMRDRLAAQRQRWSELHATLCRSAIAAGDPGVVLASESCFATRREELQLVADAMLSHAHRHADAASSAWDEQRERWEQQLGAIEDCLAPQRSPGMLATRAHPAETTLGEGQAALLMGEPGRARPLLERAIVAAGATDDRVLRARARLALARAAIDLQDNGGAEAQLIAAVRDAEAGGDDLTAADAESWLVYLLGDRSDHPASAHAWFERGMGRLERLGLERSPRAFDLHYRDANAALRTGADELARLRLDQASALREALGTDEHRRAREERSRAELAARGHDLPTAIHITQTALDRLRRELGPEATSVGRALQKLGVYTAVGDPTTAESVYRHALAIFDRRLGPDSLDAASVHLDLARLYYETNRPHHALYHARASAPLLRAGDPRHRGAQVQAWATQGLLELAFTGRLDRAAAAFRRGIALAEGRTPSPAEASNLILLRLGAGETELRRGRLADAEAALSPLLTRGDGNPQIAEYRVHLGLIAGEVALAAGNPVLAAQRARMALTTPQVPSAANADVYWLLARALGPREREGQTIARELLAVLRADPTATHDALDAAAVERWLAQGSNR